MQWQTSKLRLRASGASWPNPMGACAKGQCGVFRAAGKGPGFLAAAGRRPDEAVLRPFAARMSRQRSTSATSWSMRRTCRTPSEIQSEFFQDQMRALTDQARSMGKSAMKAATGIFTAKGLTQVARPVEARRLRLCCGCCRKPDRLTLIGSADSACRSRLASWRGPAARSGAGWPDKAEDAPAVQAATARATRFPASGRDNRRYRGGTSAAP